MLSQKNGSNNTATNISYLFNFDVTFIAFCSQFNWLEQDIG